MHADLEDAIKTVFNDLSEDNKDGIDIEVKSRVKKKQKLCKDNNHINYDVKSRKFVIDPTVNLD